MNRIQKIVFLTGATVGVVVSMTIAMALPTIVNPQQKINRSR